MEENLKTAHSLLDKALSLLSAKNPNQALETLIPIDNEIQDLEHVRALCFIELDRIEDAYQSLEKELKKYPHNTLAKELYSQVATEYKNTSKTSPSYSPEFLELYNFCKQVTHTKIEELSELFNNAKELCEKKIPGNFLQLGLCDGSVYLLAIAIARYSTMPRWIYVLDGGLGNTISPKDMMDIAEKIGVHEVIKPLSGSINAIPKLQKEWVGMLSYIHIGQNAEKQCDSLLDIFKGNLLEGGRCFLEGRGIIYSRNEPFATNDSIEQTLIQDFKSDDVVELGVVSQMCINERFQLYYTVRKCIKPVEGKINFIEVGSFAGGSLLMSYMGLKKHGAKIHGYAVEPFGEQQFYSILDRLKEDVTHLKMFSHPASETIKEIYTRDGLLADFILIDGDHTYEGVRQDIIDFYPLLRPGGVMLFHDYLPELNDENKPSIYFHHGDKEPGIRQAVEELMVNEYKAEHVELPLLRPTDCTQTQAHLPIIPGVHSTIRVYRKI